MKQCTSKEQRECFFFTKETKDKYLKILEPNIDTEDYVTIKEDINGVIVDYPEFYSVYYFYNHWYVRSDDWKFTRYTDKEFREKFELVGE